MLSLFDTIKANSNSKVVNHNYKSNEVTSQNLLFTQTSSLLANQQQHDNPLLDDLLLDNANWSPDMINSTNFNFIDQPAPRSHQSTSSSSAYSSNYYYLSDSNDSDSNLSAATPNVIVGAMKSDT